MQEILSWMTENTLWLWLASGLVLLAGEMILPGVYLLWLGIAAILTAVVNLLLPTLGIEIQFVIFSILAVIAIILANRYFYGKDAWPEASETVNVRGRKHVGKTYEVIQAIHNGRGKVKVGDSQWLAEGEDAEVGDLVEVIDIQGSVLKVARKG
ncbi:membrane protein [Kordiimonas sediminis]|uniref:Membrane protein n=1 Tax=Kordiimonas sediminis TaxID=1735581 RepID=A0A919AZ19_9PROT|nr:NfeD family protein [Kordiimonas sediminis]GHF30090.1 membrane protein [Kordiimonas sediminis]